MAKLTGPLLSLGARGSVADTVTFSRWRGRPYARQKVIPGDPNTAEQQLTRNAFAFLQAVYKVAPPLFTAPWGAYATGKVLTDRNAFVKFNLPVLRDTATLDAFVASPGALGGLPPTAVVATPGDDQLSIAITAPELPTGWTIQGAVAVAIREQDPDSGVLYTITAGEDLTSTYTVVLTGLASAVEYQYRGFLRWVRPDLQIAYSPAIGGQASTT